MEVFDEVRRVLRNDGTCWVVIGDSYHGSNKGAGSNSPSKETFRFKKKPKVMGGTPKCQALIPERFTTAMVDRGWIRRNKLIWHKPNCVPESVADRFTRDFEEVFFFVKKRRYYFTQQFTPYKESTIRNATRRSQGGVSDQKQLAHKPTHSWAVAAFHAQEQSRREEGI